MRWRETLMAQRGRRGMVEINSQTHPESRYTNTMQNNTNGSSGRGGHQSALRSSLSEQKAARYINTANTKRGSTLRISGLGITAPLRLATRTRVPSSKNLYETFVGNLKKNALSGCEPGKRGGGESTQGSALLQHKHPSRKSGPTVREQQRKVSLVEDNNNRRRVVLAG